MALAPRVAVPPPRQRLRAPPLPDLPPPPPIPPRAPPRGGDGGAPPARARPGRRRRAGAATRWGLPETSGAGGGPPFAPRCSPAPPRGRSRRVRPPGRLRGAGRGRPRPPIVQPPSAG